jgi:acyl-CoA synthetase (AMP-forming)/AMP-acid ligase II
LFVDQLAKLRARSRLSRERIEKDLAPSLEKQRAILELDPSASALEFERRWYSWGDLARTADGVDRALRDAGVGEGASVGVLLRNRPVPVGLMLGCLRAGACLVTINPTLGADRVRADLANLDLAVLAGERADIDAHVDAELASGTVVLVLDDLGAPPDLRPPDAPSPPTP